MDHYTDRHETFTIAGEKQYSPHYSYTVVDVEGSVKAAASLTVTGHIVAISNPDGGGVDWEKVGETSTCPDRAIAFTTSKDGNNFWVKVKPESGNGSITVLAKHPNLSSCTQEFTVAITGCEACQGACSAGGADIGACSASAIFYLGQGNRGDPAGRLQISAETPSLDLATPRQLALSAFDPTMEVIRVPDGVANVLRQVVAPETFVDLVPISSFKYEIRFYKPTEAGAKDTNGLYVPTGVPFISYALENPAAGTNDFNTLRITEMRGSATVVYEYVYSETVGVGEWALSSGNGLKSEVVSTVTNATGRVFTRTVRDSAGQIASKTRTTFRNFDWGEAIIEQVEDPDGAALTTTRTYYDDDAIHPGQYGQLKQVNKPDGSWRRYDYDPEGREILEVSSWLNAPTNATAGAAQARYQSYASVDPLDDGTALAHQPRLVEEKILGTTVSKTFYACYFSTNNPGERLEIEERATMPSAAYGAAGNLRTTRVYYPVSIASGLPESGKLKGVTSPDGRLANYFYEAGDYASGTFAPSLTGAYVRATTVHGTAGSPAGIANRTTQEATVSDRFGRTVLQEQYVYTGGGYDLIAWTQNTLDEFGRELSRRQSNGEEADTTWACCGKDYEKNANGIERTFSYDALKRLVFSTKAGIAAGTYPAQEAIATTYTLDALGRQVQTVVNAGSLSQVSSNAYDLAGRSVRSVDTAGLVRETAYANNGLTTTETLPGGFTRITERFKDGQVKAITGTAQISQYYEYGVNEDGAKWTKVYSASNNSPVWVKTTTDLLDRSIKVEKPGYAGTEITENFYNSKGQMVKTTTTGRPDTLFAYDELGKQIRSGLDVNANGIPDLASLDRISESDTSYEQVSGIWYLASVSRIYATDNSATPLTTSITREKLTGLSGGTRSVASALDFLGNETITTITVDRDNKLVTQTTDIPDSSSNVITVAVNGLVQSTTSKSGLTTSYTYDPLGRRIGQADARIGLSTHYDSHGWVDYIEDAAGNRTSFTFDPATGRNLSESKTVNGEPHTTYFAYTSYGKEEKIWGSASYPVHYEYDSYGRKTKQHTYRDGSGWSGPAWPASPGTADTTEWIYHEPSGLPIAKTDAAGKQVSYTYTGNSKLETRNWARRDGTNDLVTTYFYNDSSDLTGIDYSDSTPDVSFTYDRLGRQRTAASSVSAHTFAYSGLLLDTETIVSSAGTNVIDRSHDSLGRSSGFTVAGVADPGSSVAYGYDSLGRFSQISNFQFQASYSYLANSDLIETLSTDNGLLITRSYEPHRNLLTEIENALGTNTVSAYTYANDPLGRRVSAVWGGTAFDELGPTVMKYAYNTRSEVIGAERFFGDDPATATEPTAGQNWDYAFDPIGNRQTAARDGDTEIYTANNLNQYTQRTIPGAAHLAGTADEDSTVTINRPSISGTTVEPVTRQGAYFHKKLSLDNSGHADKEEIEVIGVKAGAGTGGVDIVSAYTGFVWAAKSPEQFTYDADGNMLSDALRKYEWDGENRLIAVTVSNVVDGSLTRVEMEYDYMSRRVSKKVYSWSSSNFEFQISSIRHFLYDGWNLIREITTATGLGSITDDYVWGLDLSGSLQGAGGIGGLLARYRSVHRYYDEQGMLIICHHPPGNPENRETLRINENAWPAHQAHGDTLGACGGASISNSAFLYTYDGNGNVSELLLSSVVGPPSSVVAHYEYSPFGELIAAVGPEAFDNPYRFSTKYYDEETALVMYQLRPYSPSLGRWLSRDPVGEDGGINLYKALVVNAIDVLGLWGIDPWVDMEIRGIVRDRCTGGDYGVCSVRGSAIFQCDLNIGVVTLYVKVDDYFYFTNLGRHSAVIKLGESFHYNSTKQLYNQLYSLAAAHNNHPYLTSCDCEEEAENYQEQAGEILDTYWRYNEGLEVVHKRYGAAVRREFCGN
ncbi:MAG: RHS repeat-associated core domain-containing protein [Lentisphaerae bacterium]|nr:RHS repeat-associated core domain-containing protein [Lentisphaerota bacterium]